MDDEVATRLAKMKLTIEEEEIIPISDEGRLDAIEGCNLSLMGKFLTCKPFNRMAAKNTIRRAWGLNDSLQISKVGPNLFQFKFQSEFDLDRILRGGPWSFDNQLLLLKRWTKGMTVGNIQMDSASLWIQIWDAPFDMISSQVAREVGSRLGTVEEVERRYRKDDVHMFMRVRVALPIAKPLRRGGFIAGSDGEKMWVSFKYERLPMFCHFCGILGHDLKNCAAHFAAEKQGRKIEYQYGDFMKANGSRPRAPTTKSGFSIPRTEDGNGSTVKLNSGQAVQGLVQVQPAAKEDSMENPSNVDKDPSVNQGMGAEIAHGKNVSIDCHANVKELIAETGELNADMGPVSKLVGQSNTELNGRADMIMDRIEHNKGLPGLCTEERSEHAALDTNTLLDKDGPSRIKPIGTWTRINRMEFGLGGLTKAIILPGLGKQNSHEVMERRVDAQATKKSKVDSDDGSTEFKSRYGQQDMKQLMVELLDMLTSDEMDLFWAQAWLIWNQRNSVVHGGRMKDPSSLNKRAVEYVDEYKQAQCHLSVRPGQQQSVDVWQPPSHSEYKLNFDAAIFSGLDRSGIGAIIRNDKGEVMAAMSASGPRVSTSDEAELLACRRAIEFAVDAGFSRLIVEGDSSNVIHSISSSSENFSLLGNVVSDIRHLLGGLQWSRVCYVRRGANQVAHALAQYARNSLDTFLVWMEDSPPPAIEALYHDSLYL
ncbi:hypothetical protein SO802_008871 [Lithocarpus litseifolius]|uniref:RNase H type-1 domain-containing protein n=1 Tax=Lithocarpus litseifolius TaxID=425828 RepID=A0AAW2DB87_9ROSI